MLIGVTGTLGSGKDTLSRYLTNKKGFFHFSLSDAIREECEKRRLPKDRDTLVNLGNELRSTLGNDILAKRAMEVVQKQKAENSVITSIRNPDEVKFLKSQPGFVMIAVDAPVEVRYQRIAARRREGDFVDFETFKAQEQKEMSGAAHEQSIGVVIKMADYHLVNDGTIEEFFGEIEKVLNTIRASDASRE